MRTDIPYGELSSQERNIVLYGTGSQQYSVSFVNDQGRKNTYNSKFEGVINTLTRRYYDGGVEHGHYEDYVTNVQCP